MAQDSLILIHPILQTISIIILSYVAYLGWQRYKSKFDKYRDQNIIFQWNTHVRMGILFLILILLGSILGFLINKYTLERPFFDSGPHAYLGIIIVALFAIGVGMGYRLSNGHGADNLPKLHMLVNYFGIGLVLVQILLGISLLIEVLGF
ncbi:MAG: DUF4079 family protein [Nitrospirae bacterium]|nr:DUF4079 family protein [Nitrospirota bacterium]